MIYLEKGKALFDNPAMVVYDQTGYYNDGDPVICSSAEIPDEPVCRYEAKFIAYGSLVYSETDIDKLTEEIMKLDPNSLFGKDSQQVAVEKTVEAIVPQQSGDPTQEATPQIVSPAPEITSTQESIVTESSTTSPSAVIEPAFASTTPPAVLDPISTTTPPTLVEESGLPVLEEPQLAHGSGSTTSFDITQEASLQATTTATTTPQ